MSADLFVPTEVADLAPFVEAGVFGPAEIHLATTLAAADPTASFPVLLGAALAVRAPLQGSVCVDLATIDETVVSSITEPVDPVAVPAETSSIASSVGRSGHEPDFDDDPTDVARTNDHADAPAIDDLGWPSLDDWTAALTVSPLVQVIGPDGDPIVRAGAEAHRLRPLVLDGGRLYLARYWSLERFVGADLVARANPAPSTTAGSPAGTEVHITELFAQAAARTGSSVDPSQLDAARAVAHRNLVVVSGGPGTGKTTTVARLLAGLVTSQLDTTQLDTTGTGTTLATGNDRIALVAPTGKAAARMTEAIRQAIDVLADDLPDPVRSELGGLGAVTIHRLLGTRGPGFRHGPGNPLPHDVVIVDEVSMVSLSLMAHLLAAIRPEAKVVLVGDPYQLASVEAGTVLGDMVGIGGETGTAGEPVPPEGIAASVQTLTQVHRQKEGSTILDLATAIRHGDGDEVIRLLRHADPSEITWVDPGDLPDTADGADGGVTSGATAEGAGVVEAPTLFDVGLGSAAAAEPPTGDADGSNGSDGSRSPEARTPQVEGERRFRAVRAEVLATAVEAVRCADGGDVAGALDAISGVKVLCALRRGATGVDGWNRDVDDALRHRNLIGREAWYPGRPAMVVENDYLNDVFNGDVGVAVPVRAEETENAGSEEPRYQVVFRRTDGDHTVEAVRLDRVVTQWAMSIHKSQGSEFPHAVVVLPPPPARILTRELLYTGVTRAKERLTIIASEASIRHAVDRPVARASGLAGRLH